MVPSSPLKFRQTCQILALNSYWHHVEYEKKTFFCSVIKHYFLRGKTAKETKEKLDKYYGISGPSDYTVKYWFREFRGGRNSADDEVCSGRPSDAVKLENVKKKLFVDYLERGKTIIIGAIQGRNLSETASYEASQCAGIQEYRSN